MPDIHILPEHDEAKMRSLIPEGCFFFLSICSPTGSRIYCNMPPGKIGLFLEETKAQLKEADWKS